MGCCFLIGEFKVCFQPLQAPHHLCEFFLAPVDAFEGSRVLGSVVGRFFLKVGNTAKSAEAVAPVQYCRVKGHAHQSQGIYIHHLRIFHVAFSTGIRL